MNNLLHKFPFLVVRKNRISYTQGLLLQEEMHRLCCEKQISGALLLMEHPSTITFGKNARYDHLLSSEIKLKQLNIELVKTDRGGEATAHEPGQLVIYPVLPLELYKLTVKSYVTRLENFIVAHLFKFYGVQAQTYESYPGIWIEKEKICALGIRIKQKVTLHGLAINVENDLSTFSHIVPCGLSQYGVTSLEKVLRVSCPIELFKASITQELMKEFSIQDMLYL